MGSSPSRMKAAKSTLWERALRGRSSSRGRRNPRKTGHLSLFGESVGDDLFVVEGQIDRRGIQARGFGGVAGGGLIALLGAAEEGAAYVVAAGIAVGIRIDADEAHDLHLEPGLL